MDKDKKRKYILFKSDDGSKKPCAFFVSAEGCKNGAACKFSHEIQAAQPAASFVPPAPIASAAASSSFGGSNAVRKPSVVETKSSSDYAFSYSAPSTSSIASHSNQEAQTHSASKKDKEKKEKKRSEHHSSSKSSSIASAGDSFVQPTMSTPSSSKEKQFTAGNSRGSFSHQ